MNIVAAPDDRRFPRPGALSNEGSRDFENARFYLKRKRGPYFEAIVLFKTTATIRREKGARRSIKERDAAFLLLSPFFVSHTDRVILHIV